MLKMLKMKYADIHTHKIHTQTHAYKHMYTYAHTHMHIFAYMHTYVHTHTHTHTHESAQDAEDALDAHAGRYHVRICCISS